jgi:hypothetical protein
MTTPEEWAGLVRRCREMGAIHAGFANRIVGGTVDEQLARLRQFVDETRSEW